jgi:protein TonB
MRTATAERLAFALAVSAGAHFAVLANAPLAPGRGEMALFSGQPLTARIVSAPASSQIPEPPQQPPVAAPASIPPVAPPAAVAQAAAALPSAEIFFRGSEVDERATPLNEVNLVYPERALANGQSGVVTLRLKIDHLGVLRDAAVVDAQPADTFESAALKAVRELRFRPALRNGVPVGSVKTIEVPFNPDCQSIGTCISGPQDKGLPR